VCGDIHIGDILYDAKEQELRLVTGRKMGETTVIQNMSRDYWESEHLWAKCREEQRGHNYKLCSSCHERFKCWTASRPNPFRNDDFTQAGLRIQQIIVDEVGVTAKQMSEAFTELSKAMVKVENNILNVYGVSPDALR